MLFIHAELIAVGGHKEHRCTKELVKLQQRKWVIDQSCSMLYACSSPAVVTASDGLFLVVVGCRNGD